jgi:Fe2+ transport system protein FeoA
MSLILNLNCREPSMTGLLPATELIVLGFLTAGQSATVETVMGLSDDAHRLQEIGLRAGARVQMIQPGNPCLVRLGDQRLGLRSDSLAKVLVRPEPHA